MIKRVILKIDKGLLERSREVLISQIGLKEKTNKNDGEHIRNYMKSVGLAYGKGYPYCAAGQYWCFWFANGNQKKGIPVLSSGSANGILDHAIKNGVVESYQKLIDLPLAIDDLIIWKNPKNYTGHIERVTKILNGVGVVETVGFNTQGKNDGDQRDGGGNFIKIRHLEKPLGVNQLRGIIHFETI